MSSALVPVAIHPSQHPAEVRRALLASLRTRRVNHKFHYDSIKQTNRWLALHQVYAPSRNDEDCAATYDQSFAAAAARLRARRVQLVGLGCGGGQKDTRLLQALQARGKAVSYVASDVSVAMTLVAHEAARQVVAAANCFPLVCDLATAEHLPDVLNQLAPARGARLFTFFGMIPNFEPQEILPKLAALMRRSDALLFSANLAPGLDYAAGVRRILPQYDNALMREWLLTFLYDLGVARRDGELRFSMARGASGLLRVMAHYEFRRAVRLVVEGEVIQFQRGARIRLFYSYRYTPELVRRHLARHGLGVRDEWIAASGEEGVFLCRRQ